MKLQWGGEINHIFIQIDNNNLGCLQHYSQTKLELIRFAAWTSLYALDKATERKLTACATAVASLASQ